VTTSSGSCDSDVMESGTTSISEAGANSSNAGVMTSSGSCDSGVTTSYDSGVISSDSGAMSSALNSMVWSGRSGRRGGRS
jgi:hypothetical protein